MQVLLSILKAILLFCTLFLMQSKFLASYKFKHLPFWFLVFIVLDSFAFYRGYLGFLLYLAFIFAFNYLFFAYSNLKAIIYTGLFSCIMMVSRLIVATWFLLYRGENRFLEVSNGFKSVVAALCSYLVVFLFVFIFRHMRLSVQKAHVNSSESVIHLALVDSGLLIVSLYILNRMLRYFILNKDFIPKISDLNSFFFGSALFWVVLTFLVIYFFHSFWLSNEKLSIIKTEADLDPLTGVYNRRAGLNRLLSLYNRNKQLSLNFVLCFIDVNNLKVVNDRYGHPEGDRLIVTVARTCVKTLRSADFMIRYGGDEFVIVFQNCALLDAQNAWNRIVSEFENINLTTNNKYLISASAGFSSLDENPTLNVKELIDIADTQMYKSKRIYKSELFNYTEETAKR